MEEVTWYPLVLEDNLSVRQQEAHGLGDVRVVEVSQLGRRHFQLLVETCSMGWDQEVNLNRSVNVYWI